MQRVILVLMILVLLVSSMALTTLATGTLYFTQQPKDQYAAAGSTVTFSCAVNQSDVTYLWESRKVGGKWGNHSTKSSFTVDATDTWNNRAFRCTVTDSAGNTIVSHVAHLYVDDGSIFVYVTGGVNTVIQWVSIVVNALTNTGGALNPLLGVLAVGIAVAALLLGVKVIRSFAWGT